MRNRYDPKPNLTLAGLLFWCLFAMPSVYWGYSVWVASVRFDIGVGGHLKRAADANTIEIAASELDKALSYAESHNLTKGSTHVLWPTPATDLEFWYNNLKTADNELKNLSPEVSPLEKSNMLIKLRETIIDHGEKGDYITVPYRISVYPDQLSYFVGGLVCAALIVIAILCVIFIYRWD